MSLLLTTPEQHGFQDPSLQLDAQKLQHWLGGLPVLNTGEAIRLVLNALEPLNEQRLDSSKRLQLLGIYRATVNRLFSTAEPLRLRQQALSTQQRQDTIDNVERLTLAMANGYKIVVKQLHAQIPPSAMSGFARVLHCTLQQLAAALLHSYRFYRPEPALIFLELNQIFRLARQHAVHETVPPDEPGGSQTSLSAMFQAICLLSLCDPFSLAEGLADRYFATLLRYTPAGRVLPGNNWKGAADGLFCIDLLSDTRPRHCVYLQPPLAGDEPCFLDERRTLQQMHEALQALPAERRGKLAEADLIRLLLPELTARDKRRPRHAVAQRRLGLVCGVADIHASLSGVNRAAAPGVQHWQVVNVGDHGYGLVRDAPLQPLQVGELLCAQEDTDVAQATGRLLVIRWLRAGRNGATEMGVECLDGVPEAVRIFMDHPDATECPGLLLTTGEGGLAQLVTPAQVYREDSRLRVCVGGHELPVRCGVPVAQTPGFDCFEFALESEEA
jgi:hypothetical protein